MSYVGDNKIKKIYIGDTKIKKVYVGDTKVYSAGNIVTYYVNTNVVYQEEVDADETVLSPKTFVPTLSGWTFVGWRQDSIATGDVLKTLSMGSDPITLYAVFQQNITLSYNGNGNNGGSVSAEIKQRYYNNNIISNPSFTVKANSFTKNNHTFVQWRLNGTSGTAYKPNATLTLTANATLYAEWRAALTVSSFNMPSFTVASSTSMTASVTVAGGATSVRLTPDVWFLKTAGSQDYGGQKVYIAINGTRVATLTLDIAYNYDTSAWWGTPCTVNTDSSGKLVFTLTFQGSSNYYVPGFNTHSGSVKVALA